jgi:hypothetical protein
MGLWRDFVERERRRELRYWDRDGAPKRVQRVLLERPWLWSLVWVAFFGVTLTDMLYALDESDPVWARLGLLAMTFGVPWTATGTVWRRRELYLQWRNDRRETAA